MSVVKNLSETTENLVYSTKRFMKTVNLFSFEWILLSDSGIFVHSNRDIWIGAWNNSKNEQQLMTYYVRTLSFNVRISLNMT